MCGCLDCGRAAAVAILYSMFAVRFQGEQTAGDEPTNVYMRAGRQNVSDQSQT